MQKINKTGVTGVVFLKEGILHKKCKGECKQEKPTTEFSVLASRQFTPTSFRSQCKRCRALKTKEYSKTYRRAVKWNL